MGLGLALYVVLVLGFVGPFLVSSDSTTLVVGGLALAVSVPFAIAFTIETWSRTKEGKKILRQLNKSKKDK